MTIHRPNPTPRTRGFTLFEIMIAVGIMGIVTLSIFSFMIQALNVYYFDTGRILVNKDIRTFTHRITQDATASSYFRIYPSFSSRWTGTGNTTDAAVSDGQSGDFLVLVFDYTDPTTGTPYITRLIGYYRNPSTSGGTGPVKRFDVTLSPKVNATTTTIAALLDANVPTSTAGSNSTVVQLAQGLSNGTLFYDFYGRSAMVKGQIYESGNQYQQAVNTYNFTVSPRD